MQRENRGGHPGAGQLQPLENSQHQNRGQRVKSDVDEMIGKRPRAPKSVFDPENSMEKRIILRSRGWIGPDSRQAVHRTQCRDCDMDFVVPDWFSVPSRLISERRRNDQN